LVDEEESTVLRNDPNKIVNGKYRSPRYTQHPYTREDLEEQLRSPELDKIRREYDFELGKRRMAPTLFAQAYGTLYVGKFTGFLAMRNSFLSPDHIAALKKDLEVLKKLPIPDFKRSTKMRPVILKAVNEKKLSLEEVKAITGLSATVVNSYLKQSGGLYLGREALDQFLDSLKLIEKLKTPDVTAQAILRHQAKVQIRDFSDPPKTLSYLSRVPLKSIQKFLAGETVSSHYAASIAAALGGGGAISEGTSRPPNGTD
jgi:hypothetical protein